MPARRMAAAQYVYDERREEAAKLLGVAVYPLDHLSGRVPVVEGHVEHHAVAGEVAAQGVGRRPANAPAGVGGGNIDRLLHEGDEGE